MQLHPGLSYVAARNIMNKRCGKEKIDRETAADFPCKQRFSNECLESDVTRGPDEDRHVGRMKIDTWAR
jgi:hypothetical protein